ncbi:MAG TPA: hypothetical protein VFM54_24285 [Micromonosporaceae bacterium]|nr:hypothetical protein [Micromonosporaceae bacterium]
MHEHAAPDPESREPVRIAGLVTAAGSALLALAVALGLPLPGTVQAAILTALPPLTALVLMVVVRGRVYSPATVAQLLATPQPKVPRPPDVLG